MNNIKCLYRIIIIYILDEDKNPLLHYPGDYNIVVPGHRDINYRQDVLEKQGVSKQILTFTTPGTAFILMKGSRF